MIRYLMKEGKARNDRILEQEKMDMKSGRRAESDMGYTVWRHGYETKFG